MYIAELCVGGLIPCIKKGLVKLGLLIYLVRFYETDDCNQVIATIY